MTDEQFAAWLASGGRRCVLVEIDTDVPLLLSDHGYTTLPTDTPANVPYLPVIAGGVSVQQEISLSGSARLSYGDIELHNEDGALDCLLDYVFEGRAIRVYYGDLSWPRADFRLQMRGVVARLSSRRRGTLNILLQDKLADLDASVTEAVIGGTGPNKDMPVPVVLGEVHNITAVLVDAAIHRYRVHIGATERIIEVRDDGAPVSFVDRGDGTFTLNKSPKGQITASVQGDKTGGIYRNTIAKLVELLAKQYGTKPLTAADLDAANLAAFEAAHPQPVGMAILNGANVLSCCQQLAASVGAQVSVSRLAQLRLVKLALPAPGTPVEIRPEDYEHGSLAPGGEPDILAAVRIAYCRNWTVQQSLETGLPADHRALFAREWLTALEVSASTATTYRLDVDPEARQTMLLTEADAQAEAARDLALWRTPRRIYSVTGFAHLALLEPGQPVRLYGDRWDLANGKAGVVLSAKPDWSKARTALEILT